LGKPLVIPTLIGVTMFCGAVREWEVGMEGNRLLLSEVTLSSSSSVPCTVGWERGFKEVHLQTEMEYILDGSSDNKSSTYQVCFEDVQHCMQSMSL